MKSRFRFEAFSDSNSVSPVHSENQDSYLAEGDLFAVADGVGGYGGAKEASRLAIEGLKARSSRIVDAESMKSCIEEIHLDVQEAAHRRMILNMGTTIAVAKVLPAQVQSAGGRIITGNAGDSPILHFGRSGMRKVFVDDSHRGEDPTAIFGIIQYVGLDCELDVHCTTFSYEHGDHLLICSDGITDNITDSKKLERLVRAEKHSARQIVEEALSAGIKADDMTAIVVSL